MQKFIDAHIIHCNKDFNLESFIRIIGFTYVKKKVLGTKI